MKSDANSDPGIEICDLDAEKKSNDRPSNNADRRESDLISLDNNIIHVGDFSNRRFIDDLSDDNGSLTLPTIFGNDPNKTQTIKSIPSDGEFIELLKGKTAVERR